MFNTNKFFNFTRKLEIIHPIGTVISALIVGLAMGGLAIYSQQLPSDWGILLLLVIPAAVVVLLVNDLKKVVLIVIYLSILLNLDVSIFKTGYYYSNKHVSDLRVSLATIGLVLGYSLWLIDKAKEKTSKASFFPSTTLPAVGLILAAVMSMLKSVDVRLSMIGVFQLIEMTLIYLYLANNITNRQDFHLFVNTMIIGLMLQSVLMILQSFAGFTFDIAGISGRRVYDDIDGYSRVSGTFGSANGAGAFLAPHILIGISVLLTSKKPSEKWLAAAATGMGALALVMTFSRGNWSAFLFSLSGFLVLGVLKGWIKIKTVVLFAVMGCLVVAAFYGPIKERLYGDDRGSAAARTRGAIIAWEVIKAHPLVGIGANTYSLVAPKYAPPEVGRLGYMEKSAVHNRYLLIWAETGVLGIVSFVALLLTAAVEGILAIKRHERHLALISMGFVAALTAIAQRLLVDHMLNLSATLLLWVIIALIVSLKRIQASEKVR